MVRELDQLRKELTALRTRFRTVKTGPINRAQDRDAVRQLVRRYFDEHRKNVARTVGHNQLQSLDSGMQDLLRFAQRRTLITRYKRLLKDCENEIDKIESEALTCLGSNSRGDFGERESLLVNTLRTVCPPAADCYEQGLLDLRDDARKSWRGTIAEFREALRETLDSLAPDEEVKKRPWFNPEPGASRPTMRQKVRFILEARTLKRSQTKPAEDAVDDVEHLFERVWRSVYDRASTGLHTPVGINEAKQIKEWVTTVLAELLEVGG